MKSIIESSVERIPVEKVLPNPNQPRKHFEDSAILELADSIKSYGVIQPIQVRKISEEFYELVSGERRLRASKVAGEKTIPAITVSMSDQDSALVAIMENVQREDLTYFEEAESYRQLIEYYKITQDRIAELIGKSQSFVANKLRLLKLDPEIVAEIIENNLSERHARSLLRIPDTELQQLVLKQVIKKDMTVKKTEELVEKIRKDVLTNNYDEKLTPEKKARVKSFINAQIYINTIKTAFKAVKESRTSAEYKEVEKDDCVEIKIIIPK